MSKKHMTIRHGLQLVPQSGPPTDAVEGDYYFDATLGLRVYWNGAWQSPAGAIGNSDRNCSLLAGGTVKWKESTDTLSWSKDAFFQVPGAAETRNKIATGSVVLANDGDVAYVDVNRDSGVAATLSTTVVNISALGTANPVNENRFVFARRSDGDVYWGLQDGQRISSTDGGVLIEKTLTDNTTSGVIFAEDASDYDTIIVKFSMKRGTAVEVGHLYITNNGTTAGIGGAGNELSDVGVSFATVINGTDVELQYTSTSTGTDIEMRYVIEKWDAS